MFTICLLISPDLDGFTICAGTGHPKMDRPSFGKSR